VNNLGPLNSLTSLFIIISVWCFAWFVHHPYCHLSFRWNWKNGWEYVDMRWCQGAQNTGLSSRKLKSALKCTCAICKSAPYDQNTRPSQTDKRTDGRTDG